MTRFSTRLTHSFVTFSALALVFAASCGKKEKTEAGSTEPTTTAKAPSDRGSGELKPPEVAIGADRVKTFGAGKKVAENAEYAVSIVVPDSVTAGKTAAAKVVLTPKEGWKLNDEFPYLLSVAAPEGVKVAKAKQEKSDAVKWDKVAEWAISFTPESAGSKSFTADFEFAVCTPATCNPYEEKLAFNVDVK